MNPGYQIVLRYSHNIPHGVDAFIYWKDAHSLSMAISLQPNTSNQLRSKVCPNIGFSSDFPFP
jgi:hypothetical protein